MFEPKEIPMSNTWFGNMVDFLHWCDDKKRRLIKLHSQPHGQTMGYDEKMFCNKYPTVEDAYKEYKKQFEGD